MEYILKNQDDLIQVASISGGRTSHYMITTLIEKYGKEKVKFIYCDTGAEHPETYEFIKDTKHYFDIDITCLRLNMPKESGKGARYDIVNVDDLKQDFKAFRSLMEKYGRPYMPGGKFCTDQMKTQIYKKYCDKTFGKNSYVTWIGYRDEPKDSSRVWGHTLSGTLSKWFDIPQREQGDFYKDCRDCLLESEKALIDFISDHNNTDISDEKTQERIKKVYDRVVKRYVTNYRFLFEISNYDKNDILSWWEEQDFNLNIPPHCGNCVFCIEKSTNQLMYLVKSQPQQANLWKAELDNLNIPYKGRSESEDAVYRGKLSFQDLIDMSHKYTIQELEDMVKVEKKLRPCATGECSVFGDQD